VPAPDDFPVTRASRPCDVCLESADRGFSYSLISRHGLEARVTAKQPGRIGRHSRPYGDLRRLDQIRRRGLFRPPPALPDVLVVG